jgi:8-oxo-dGTP pyrophosphatase MutT (NUDIX family)
MGSNRFIDKVTVFVIRAGRTGSELLLFEHPHAGIQIPAGTVEASEAPETAARREVWEESGLNELGLARILGVEETRLPGKQRVVLERSIVYARPDTGSFDWASLPRGCLVHEERRGGRFVQVTYAEGDRYPAPAYITYRITGWVVEDALGDSLRRTFFQLESPPGGEVEWLRVADNHRFRLFWAPIYALPEIILPQRAWLDHLEMQFGFRETGGGS